MLAEVGGEESALAYAEAVQATRLRKWQHLQRVARGCEPNPKLPGASGTYVTQEADTSGEYVQYGGPRAYVSARGSTARRSG